MQLKPLNGLKREPTTATSKYCSYHPTILYTNISLIVIASRYAQYIVGIHYEQGMIVQSDMEKARSYYLLSAQQEFPDSQTALGIALLQAGEYAQGIKWLEMSAQKVCPMTVNFVRKTMY